MPTLHSQSFWMTLLFYFAASFPFLFSATLFSATLFSATTGNATSPVSSRPLSINTQSINTQSINTQAINTQSINQPDNEWLNYGRDYSEQRYSPLQQITTENVSGLGLAWSYVFPTRRIMESTPLVHKGVLYVTTGWSRVYAFKADSGALLWHFDPAVPKSHLINSCCGPANRGVAIWQDESTATLSVFVGTFDGRLIALDAATGKVRWSVQTVPENSHYTITGAPRVIKGKVLIGNGGAELGVRGYVSAYDANNGEQLWRFYTVPRNPAEAQENPALEKALPTWNGEWWKIGGGGGTVWDAMAYDPKLDLLYIGSGNGSPWNRNIRSPGGGDNLYLNSIIALRPDSGEYVWHYQVTPRDNWDYTATQHLVLTELSLPNERGQQERIPVIMQAPKNGFFYVLDRRNGKLLSAKAYAQVNWASHIDLQTGKPVENPVADYNQTGGSMLWPSPFGAHNWQPMSYSQQTGLVYIPVQHVAAWYAPAKHFSFNQHRWNTGVDFWEIRYHHDPVIAKATYDGIVRGYLIAWDPIKQAPVWKVQHKHAANGGILSTAGGLVFQGTAENAFHAYAASDGTRLWSFQTDSAVLAGPMSYGIDGEQYLAVTQGSGGTVMLTLGKDKQTSTGNPNRLLVFKLGGTERITPDRRIAPVPTTVPQTTAPEESIAEGEKLYERNCAICHGISANGSGVIPDLRYMDETTQREFQAIVLAGLRQHQGMVGFHDTLSSEQVELIHHYINRRAELLQTGEWGMGDTLRYWFWYTLTRIGDRFPWIANAGRDFIMNM